MVSGVFLLGLAATGEIFRRSGAQWGNVAEASLIFAGILAVAILVYLTYTLLKPEKF